MDKISKKVFVISDGTGETAMGMLKAALVQYENLDIKLSRFKNVRNINQIEKILDQAKNENGFVVYTLVSKSVRKEIKEKSRLMNVPTVDLLGGLLESLDLFFETSSSSDPEAGLLRTVDDKYFKRIEAIEYTVRHDDGKTTQQLDEADIVLVGISRTSKTPLSIFLSHKGWKVANIPLVPETPLPKELFEIDQKKVVGLTIDEAKLRLIRRKRLENFGQDPGSTYANMEQIQKEINYANEIFKKNRRWPVVNVTDRALEETAAEVARIVSARFGKPMDPLF
jgi:[pyruvate, water dikinase]-phosphate phosphotransferase / [pyruvate, water dikinase] kinase